MIYIAESCHCWHINNVLFSLLTVLISISSGIPNHSASIQVLLSLPSCRGDETSFLRFCFDARRSCRRWQAGRVAHDWGIPHQFSLAKYHIINFKCISKFRTQVFSWKKLQHSFYVKVFQERCNDHLVPLRYLHMFSKYLIDLFSYSNRVLNVVLLSATLSTIVVL